MDKERVVSGITPSGAGELHIGNFLGAIRQMIQLQDIYEKPMYFVADLHALTTLQDKVALKRNRDIVIRDYLALGINPKKSIVFIQSRIPKVAQLTWILGCLTNVGHLKRAHAFKDKLEKGVNADDINLGLFSYPVLMAADILLYKAQMVPVGKDQHQHIEIAREIARSFNTVYGDTFPEPQALSNEETMVIIGIDGQRKMSKSLGNDIKIFATDKETQDRVSSMVTDPQKIRKNDPGRPEICNVFTLRTLFGDPRAVRDVDDACRAGRLGCVECKAGLADEINDFFKKARQKRRQLEQDNQLVEQIVDKGCKQADTIATTTLEEVREKIGL